MSASNTATGRDEYGIENNNNLDTHESTTSLLVRCISKMIRNRAPNLSSVRCCEHLRPDGESVFSAAA